MSTADAYAVTAADAPLGPLVIERREVGRRDVEIEILFCGVCHSDLHMARGEWEFPISYPLVVGHEIVGRVTSTGGEVDDLEIGQTVGVGCLVDSCRACAGCEAGLEQYCTGGQVPTYGGVEKGTGLPTHGGYSSRVVVDRDFVLLVPDGLDPAAAAPLLCAGITTYSPLRHWNVTVGSKVGVVGLGGLGHMAVKLGKAMGAEVTLFTTSPGKADDARALGAAEVVISTDAEAMEAKRGSLDLVLTTVAAPHDLEPFLATLHHDGALVLLGAPPEPHPPVQPFTLITGRRSVSGSCIGGIAETQEMLDFCAEHAVSPEIEMIAMPDIDEAWERMLAGDVKYRFVIDLATMPEAADA